MEIPRPEQIVAAANITLTPLDSQIIRNMTRPRTTDLRICHFIPVRHFRTLIQTASLSLCRCDKFKDVADGLLPPPNKTVESATMTMLYNELDRTRVDTQGRTLRVERNPAEEYRQQEMARTITYVHCWFTGDSSDESMWKDYGEDGAGVCIESSSFALLRSISKPSTVELIICGGVTYSDGSQPIATAVSYAPFFHKHQQFAKEQEIRIVAYLVHDPQTLQYNNTSERLAVPISPSTLISRVVIGRHIDHDTAIELTGLVAGFVRNAPVTRQAN